MADAEFDRKAFWEGKIIGWEQGRYDLQGGEPGLLNRLADRMSDSLRFRLAFTSRLLAPYVVDKVVVDLGCGSGLLAPAVLAAGARAYVGYDIAESAIELARARAEREGWEGASFEVGTTADLDHLDADVIVSLGLTDWLSDEELDHLFAIGGDAHVLHAYSERRETVTQWAHRAYCWAAYGYGTRGYVPRYFETPAFADRLRAKRPGEVRVVHHPRLTFGAMLTTLPVGVPVETA